MPPRPSTELARECSEIPNINPAVIPLLVADDVQVALKSRAAEAASQLAFGLSALMHGTGIAANATSLRESLTAISNHDLTSTLTVGRESESSLYALITPNHQASNQAALVSQTYDIAVLLLIPRYYFGDVIDPQSPIISVSTFSEYRDATTGKILVVDTTQALAEQADRVIPRYLTSDGHNVWRGLSIDEKAHEAERLADAVRGGLPLVFISRIRCEKEIDPKTNVDNTYPTKLCNWSGNPTSYIVRGYTGPLWVAAGSFLDYDVGKRALFQAQLPSPIKVPTQQVLLSDDGTHPMQAVLGGVSGRSAARIAAFLEVTPFDNKTWKDQPPVMIPAQSLALDANAHTLTLTFPSLKKLKIGCLSPVDIPPKPVPIVAPKSAPPSPTGSAKGVTTATATANAKAVPSAPAGKPPAATAEKLKDPDCPARPPDAGSAARPNGIVLQLVGCDPTKQLCPALTDTILIDEDWPKAKIRKLSQLGGCSKRKRERSKLTQARKRSSTKRRRNRTP